MKTFRSNDYRVLRQLLQEARRQAGLRQVDLAVRMGVPQSLVSKIEVGERRLDLLELRAICQALGLSLGEFVARLEEHLGATD